jgi:hypothetical protein
MKNARARRSPGTGVKPAKLMLPPGLKMRQPTVGPAVPVGYINVEEWGLETGRKKVAAYAAVNRGEVEVEDYGVKCIRADWRERNAARAATEAEERRRRHLEERDRRRAASNEEDRDLVGPCPR